MKPHCITQEKVIANDRQEARTERALLSKQTRRITIALYVLVALMYWIAMYLYAPTLPTYVQTKTSELTMVGVILAQYGLWQAIIRLPLGIAADSLGKRKPFILVGVALTGVGAWLLGVANDSTQLLIGRAITGIAAGTWVPLIVAFSSLLPPKEAIRATAIFSFVGSAGRILATSLTGSLNALGGYSLAYFGAAGAAVLGVVALLPVKEIQRPTHQPSAANIGRLVVRRDVLLPSLLAAVCQYANWAGSYGFLPIVAEGLGATDVTLSLLMSLHIGIVLVSSLLSDTLVKRLGLGRLVGGSLFLMTAGMGLAAIAPSLLLVFVAQSWMGIGQGMTYPVLMGLSIREVEDSQRNTAMGLHQSVYALGMFAGPWLSGMLADHIGLQPTLGVTALAVGLLFIPMTRMLTKKQPS